MSEDKGIGFVVSHRIRNNWIRESEMAINRQGNLSGGSYGQTESVDYGETLPNCQRGSKPERTHWTVARRHQVSEGLIYRWRDKFYEGGKAALAFDGRNGSGAEKAALERQVEELQKLIGEQAVEIRFLKRLSRS